MAAIDKQQELIERRNNADYSCEYNRATWSFAIFYCSNSINIKTDKTEEITHIGFFVSLITEGNREIFNLWKLMLIFIERGIELILSECLEFYLFIAQYPV